MKVKKILNNNVILTDNEQNKEIIVMGKGLAFGLKVGDPVDESRINKVFSLKNNHETSRFQQLISEVPEECMEMTEEFVDYAKLKLGKKLHDSIYITLTDHINTMFERAEFNAYVKNTMLWDIKHLYRHEFEISREIIKKINEKIGSVYDDNEAATIAFHFVNAQMNTDFSSAVKITKVISEILNIVKYYFRITYDEESFSYYRFIVHIRFFALRMFSNKTYSELNNTVFLDHVQTEFSEAYNCAKLIRKFIYDNYQYSFSNEEITYIIIHITKLVGESKKF